MSEHVAAFFGGQLDGQCYRIPANTPVITMKNPHTIYHRVDGVNSKTWLHQFPDAELFYATEDSQLYALMGPQLLINLD